MIIGRSSIFGGSSRTAGWVGTLLALGPTAYYAMQATEKTTEPDASGNNHPAGVYAGNFAKLNVGVADNPILSQPGLKCAEFLSEGWTGQAGGKLVIPWHNGWGLVNNQPWSIVYWLKPTGGFSLRAVGTGGGPGPQFSQGFGAGNRNPYVSFSQPDWSYLTWTPPGITLSDNQWHLVTWILTPTDTLFRKDRIEVARGSAIAWYSAQRQTEFTISHDGNFRGRIAHVAFFAGKALAKADTDRLYDKAMEVG